MPRKKTVTYKTWVNMKQRCGNPRDDHFLWYGGRGVSVCERWANSFEAFLEDMGERPADKDSIDRIDSSGNYEPGNCRWATARDQTRNRRTTWRVEFQGTTRPLAEWAEIHGLPYRVVQDRLLNGWTINDALTKPVRKYMKATA